MQVGKSLCNEKWLVAYLPGFKIRCEIEVWGSELLMGSVGQQNKAEIHPDTEN